MNKKKKKAIDELRDGYYNNDRDWLQKQNDVLVHYKEDGSILQSVTDMMVI